MLKKILLVTVSSIFLSGCLWNVKKDPTPDSIKQVPIKTKCNITKPVEPLMPFDNVQKTDTVLIKLKAALAELEKRIGYEGELVAAIDECNK